jgi:hypothetical protein
LLRSLLDYKCLLFFCDRLGSDLRIGHFFSFCCLLINTPQLNIQLSLRMNLLTTPVQMLSHNGCLTNAPFVSSSLSHILQLMVSRPICLGIKHPSWAYDQIFITVRQLRVCWCGVLSLMRGQSVIYNCFWPSPAQSFSGLSLVVLVTIFYCLIIPMPRRQCCTNKSKMRNTWENIF